jgi:putative membrane protein
MMYEARRLHPIAALLQFLKHLRELIIPAAIFFFVSGGQREHDWFLGWYLAGIGVIVFFILIYGIISWYCFTYRVEDGELRIEHGVFVKKKRYIPIERIQSINLTSGLIQRMFGLVKLQIETAGGGFEAEAVLSAISKDEANRLQKVISNFKNDQNAEIEEPIQGPTYKLSGKELLIAASTSGRIGVVLSAVFAFLSQFDELIPFEELFDKFQIIHNLTFVFIAFMLTIGLVTVWLAAVIGTVIQYGQFTLEKRENELHISRGLIEKRKIILPLERIQAVRITENLIRQPLGYATVYVESAGSAAEKETDFSTVLFPLVKKEKIKDLLETFTPDYAYTIPINPIPRRSFKRYILRSCLPALAIVVPISIFLRPWGLLSILILPIAILFGYLRYRDTGWGVNEQTMVLRFRFFTRTTAILKRKRIQVFEKSQSFFQRRLQLATIGASIVSRFNGKSFKVADVDFQDGIKLFSWFSYNTENDINKEI